ncbi:pentatricopeptide repeat-containing protein At5g66520-like [Phalaenopsis equestris]|uniref:pentatricopeptide repeat-containing protein At5g66520-like n=1 Tax=Phalaenopsis equestris TaxID=78828 RepID=UPI0009E63A29|nr:pentatricopeptide repeat-containing protein At5g66520-like [Phalaenopsis equestris]
MPAAIHLHPNLQSCRSTTQLKQAHARLLKLNPHPFDGRAATQLLSSFSLSPCSNLSYPSAILAALHNPSPFHWNSLIHSISTSKSPIKALSLFRFLLRRGLKPNNHTFPPLLKSCPSLLHLLMIHAHVVKGGLDPDPYIQSALIHMYSAMDLIAARKVFEGCSKFEAFCCNAMIDGFIKNGEVDLARSVFDRMECRDVISWNTMINGYAVLGCLDDAKQLFEEMPQRNVVSWNCLLAGHAKCGDVDGARQTFAEMPNRDVISWNSMLSCYSQNGHSVAALALFDEMQCAGMRPTEATLVSLLSACSQIGALDRGERIHAFIRDSGVELDAVLATALVDMYAKCGRIAEAIGIFHSIEHKDVHAWNAIMAGLSIHGLAAEALDLFDEMVKSCARPDDITFVAVLSACSHAGMVEEGRRVLASMKGSYQVDPKVEHYGCLIDMLARAGLLEEAMELTRVMPMQPNAQAWGALLGGCRIHRNSEVAEEVGRRLLGLQPKHSGRYILLSNIYATANRWQEATTLRNMMANNGVPKNPGVSVIELHGTTNHFMAGDRSHPQTEQIYMKLSEISERLRTETEYLPDTKQVLADVEEEEKEQLLSVHSEKLAIAFGLLCASPGEAIRVVKNLRACTDCHTVSKLISRVYCREIVMRDRSRFHVFKEGACSCGDYW